VGKHGEDVEDEATDRETEADDDGGNDDGEADDRDASVDDPNATDAHDEPAGSDAEAAPPVVKVPWVLDVQRLLDALDFSIPGPGLRQTFAGFGRADFDALVAVLDAVRERLVDVGDDLDRVAEAVDEIREARRKAKANAPGTSSTSRAVER
jgi:hypothetical protein